MAFHEDCHGLVARWGFSWAKRVPLGRYVQRPKRDTRWVGLAGLDFCQSDGMSLTPVLTLDPPHTWLVTAPHHVVQLSRARGERRSPMSANAPQSDRSAVGRPPLALGQYVGTLADLASRLRRRTLAALGLSATDLIQQLRRHWRTVETVDRVADEMPVAAWVLSKKIREVLAEPDENPDEAERLDERPWVQDTTALLREYREVLSPVAFGPPRWPSPGWPAIRDAHPWRLPLAWPPGRPPRASHPLRATVEPEAPLWRRALLLVRRIRHAPEGASFQQLVADLPRAAQVEQFLVVMALWARGRVAAAQDESFGPLRLTLRRR